MLALVHHGGLHAMLSQGRLQRIEDTHRLEISRLKKEVDYHKRLRQGAEVGGDDVLPALLQLSAGPAVHSLGVGHVLPAPAPCDQQGHLQQHQGGVQ